jgi:hypothetical protein
MIVCYRVSVCMIGFYRAHKFAGESWKRSLVLSLTVALNLLLSAHILASAMLVASL